MKCERTEWANVSNKICRKKSHLLSLFFSSQIDCSDCFEVVQGAFSNGKAWGRDRVRSVTSRYHGSQISGSQQFFLTETAVCIIETMEDHAIMHRKVVHFIPYMFVFSCQICRTGLCWDPKVLLPWQRRVLSIAQGAVSRSSCELSSTRPCV